MNLLKNLFSKVFLLLFCALLFQSCKSAPDVNESFQRKFGEEVKRVKITRTPVAEKDLEKLSFSQEIAKPDWRDLDSGSSEYYANVEAKDYKGTRMQKFLPDNDDYARARSSPSNLPNDIFDITYNTTISPPFSKSGAEFDNINIPLFDAYGVKTEMSEKEYLFAGNDSLQKNIDQINSQKDQQDAEISEILIKEKRELRRRDKVIKIFGKNSSALDSKPDSKPDSKLNSNKK